MDVAMVEILVKDNLKFILSFLVNEPFEYTCRISLCIDKLTVRREFLSAENVRVTLNLENPLRLVIL